AWFLFTQEDQHGARIAVYVRKLQRILSAFNVLSFLSPRTIDENSKLYKSVLLDPRLFHQIHRCRVFVERTTVFLLKVFRRSNRLHHHFYQPRLSSTVQEDRTCRVRAESS